MSQKNLIDLVEILALAKDLPWKCSMLGDGLQALAMGLAIVASRAGGTVELVQQGINAFLADPGDREGLSNALRNFLSNHEALQIARKASRDFAHRFDIRTVVGEYETNFLKNIS